MKTILARNVNEALQIGTVMMKEAEEQGTLINISPRGQATLEYPEPVATQYMRPQERVLFSPIRDANPFFHLMESLWILAGRNDANWLARFNSNMVNYSDDGWVFHGAYGYRMRTSYGLDQIKKAIKLLKHDPDSRQVVISIWHPRLDLGAKSKDIPCNDTVFLKVRNGKLNISVACRSNDMIWGAYGANAVQFSMLQEYMAAQIGVGVGTYHQVSDSFHIYTGNNGYKTWEALKKNPYAEVDRYEYGFGSKPTSLMVDPERWDRELEIFMHRPYTNSYEEPFFKNIALPMLNAWNAHKVNKTGLSWVNDMQESDWEFACTKWLERREQ